MKRAALLLAALFAATGCGTDSPPAPDRVTAPTTTEPVATAADIAQLRAELLRLEGEIHKGNVDRADLRRKVDRYIDRASRSAARRQASAPRSRLSGTSSGCHGWAHLVFAYDWPHSTACAVLWCESRGDANAYNPRSGATGLFQILNGPFDPHENVALAYRMWQSRGWQPWKACI